MSGPCEQCGGPMYVPGVYAAEGVPVHAATMKPECDAPVSQAYLDQGETRDAVSYRAVPQHWHEVNTEIVPCPVGDCFWNEPDCGVPDIDSEPPATAADWLEVTPGGPAPRRRIRTGGAGMSGHEHLYHEADDTPMACPAEWCEWNDPHLHYPQTADEPDFPEYFQGSGPMYAAIPLGNPWLDAASKGVTTYVMESPYASPPDMTADEAGAAHFAYAGWSAFLDRADVEVMADARDGTFCRWDGLEGWNDWTASQDAAYRAAEALIADPEAS